MLGRLDRFLSNLSVRVKLALGFAIVLLLTLITTLSGWLALGDAIVSSEKLIQIGHFSDYSKDLRSERITYRVLSDDVSRIAMGKKLEGLDALAATMQQQYHEPEAQRLITDKQRDLQAYRQAFVDLQQQVKQRQQLHQTQIQQVEQLAQRVDALQEQLITRMGEVDTPRSVEQIINQVETLSRHLEVANEQSQNAAYLTDPLESFEQIGQASLVSAEALIKQVNTALANARLDVPGAAPLLGLISQYRETLLHYARQAISVERIHNHLETLGNRLMDLNQAMGELQAQLRDQEAVAARSLMMVIALLALVIGLLAAWAISLQITRPLDLALTQAGRIAQGDLAPLDSSQRKDELGQLQHSMGDMTVGLRELIGGLEGGVEQLSLAVHELATVSEATQLQANQQREETEQVATAMNQMSATVHEVAQNAEQAAQAARRADQQAQVGDEVVAQSIEQIEQLAGHMDTCLAAMRHLSEEGQRIGSILEVITAVSQQTNLLALNAAIEAARAGEAGRGFAVVADEVRGLAQRTQQSTEEIGQLITSLHSGTENVTHLLDHSKRLTERSVALSRQTGEALGQITETVSSIQGMNQQIATASEEQSVVAEQINRSVMGVREGADRTSATSEQTAAASGALEALGQQLRAMVGKFSL
ncbi:methyl-accepting chemotaxis protein [Pseudomonas sp. RP23018S]|uniref:methyl-accepting chemotaxis protein n=1 Tax=Pseudomonas sp. RP23018S TaxID=3096037 RepID=UPI002ACA3998|nr:methyl-accepting chemotaxis protein [Pseudomonas sp. RP23018S]MDZ5604154.1 methyl-accepting chemotaxis protein [Pseudomonas sp. RP23018S]